MHRLFTGISAGIVLLALAWGFVLVGSPLRSRQAQFDERRVEDLRIIHQTVLNIVYEGRPWEVPVDGNLRRPLPISLQEIAEQATMQRVNVTDPQTGEPYEYNRTGATTYELCATFNALRDEPFDVFWNHGQGRTCFPLDASRADGYGGVEQKPIVPTMVK